MVTTNQETTVSIPYSLKVIIKSLIINKVQVSIAESDLEDKNELYELLSIVNQL